MRHILIYFHLFVWFFNLKVVLSWAEIGCVSLSEKLREKKKEVVDVLCEYLFYICSLRSCVRAVVPIPFYAS